MLLKGKIAVIYGSYGAVGSAVAKAYAAEGATLFLTGRDRSRLELLASECASVGNTPEIASVDAQDEATVERHLDRVMQENGRIDISFNALGIPQPGIQGRSLIDLSVDAFLAPLLAYPRSHFITARAAAKRMLKRQSGVILMHTPEPARVGAPLIGGMGPAWAALEALTRDLSAELAPNGIRALCLRTTGLPETETIKTVFGLHAAAIGITREQFQALMDGMAHHRRSTRLSELTRAAVFAASDLAEGLFGTTMNLTAGKSPD